MTDISHFAYPLRYIGGAPVVNEQDSTEDVVDCIKAVCLTHPGDRIELPDFGILDFTGMQQPLSTDAMVKQLEAWEPRASLLADEAPDALDDAIAQVDIQIVVTQ